MICYLDNDVLCHVAELDVWIEALAVICVENRDVRITPTARYSLHFAKNTELGVKKFGKTTHALICRMIASMKAASEAVTPEDADALDVPSIDDGEKLLFALASRDPNSIVCTGDKRSLRALANEKSCAGVAERLAGRIVGFDMILLRLLDKYGYATVAPHLRLARECTKHVANVVQDEVALRNKLKQLVGDLRSRTGRLLALEERDAASAEQVANTAPGAARGPAIVQG